MAEETIGLTTYSNGYWGSELVLINISLIIIGIWRDAQNLGSDPTVQELPAVLQECSRNRNTT